MRKGDKKLFTKDRNKLYEASKLRRDGWSYTSISIVFDCDRKSLSNQFDKFGIVPLGNDIYTLESILGKVLKKITPKTEWRIESNGDRVCLGRNYEDYLSPYKR